MAPPSWPPGADRPVRFDAFMDAALYDPEHGFYTAGGGSAGRRGDFITSVEVGPLFGAVLAGWLDTRWDALGRPDPFVVLDAGAGPGTLARTIGVARPRCATALQLHLVEPSPAGRAAHPPDVRSAASLQACLPEGSAAQAHAIVANELLDNLPVRVAELRPDGPLELWVGPAGEQLRPLEPTPGPISAILQDLLTATRAHDSPDPGAAAGPDLAVRVPVAEQAARWVADALERLAPGGRLVVFDYGATTAELAERGDRSWLRTYRGQARGGPPTDAPGSQDITADVPFDQLPVPTELERQAAWLRRHGMDALVEEGRRQWTAASAAPDLRALRGRSRVREAEALVDPAGLGGFMVATWHA